MFWVLLRYESDKIFTHRDADRTISIKYLLSGAWLPVGTEIRFGGQFYTYHAVIDS